MGCKDIQSSIRLGHRKGTDAINLLYMDMGYGLMATAVLDGIVSGIIFQGEKKCLNDTLEGMRQKALFE